MAVTTASEPQALEAGGGMAPARRILLTILAAPLWFLGVLAAIVVTVAVWGWTCLAVGFSDGRGLMRPPQDGVSADGPS